MASADGPLILSLPEPRSRGRLSLEQALAARRSRRAYSSSPLTLAEAGQLLWAAQGVTDPEGKRTAPSAGALYPLVVYLAVSKVEGLEPGVYRYHPDDHGLELCAGGDHRRQITAAAADQDCVRFSACVILLAADPSTLTAKYGARAEKFIHIEAGHVAENVCLQAAALELGVCEVGAFDPEKVESLFPLEEQEEAVYLMTLGRRA